MAEVVVVDSNNLEEAEKQFVKMLATIGVGESAARSFYCLRFHPDHIWGVIPVLLNGYPTVGIGQPISDGRVFVRYIETNGLQASITDRYGNQMDEEGCIPGNPQAAIPPKENQN